MSARSPDFDDLVGADLEPGERERLRRAHEALVAAGPPPELPEQLSSAPRDDLAVARARRRVLLPLAAAFAVAAFGLGFLVGDGRGPSPERAVAMAGTGLAPEARATLDVFPVDDAGNWPVELEIEGLAPAANGRLHELWLTRDGELAALCGSFRPEEEGTTEVPMNAPWRLSDFDGWVIVEEGSTAPLLGT